MSQQPPPPPDPGTSPYAAASGAQFGPPPTTPPPGYAAPPPGSGPPAYAPSPVYAYAPVDKEVFASWGRRVGARLLDIVFTLPALLLVFVGIGMTSALSDSRGRPTGASTIGFVVMGVGYLAFIGLSIWNRCFRAGRTGQSWGRKVVGIRLVRESDGQPIGAGIAFVREIVHVVDEFAYLGYLWPLWDDKRQTFADKICQTMVLAR